MLFTNKSHQQVLLNDLLLKLKLLFNQNSWSNNEELKTDFIDNVVHHRGIARLEDTTALNSFYGILWIKHRLYQLNNYVYLFILCFYICRENEM